MSDEKEQPVVGERYKGSTIVNITEERTTRPNGMIRIRKAIELDSGMILLEDEFQDNRIIEGEYKELQYKEVESPRRISAKPKKVSSKKKKRLKPPPLLDQSDDENATQEAEEKARKQAEEEARRQEEENIALKEAQAEAIRRENELLAKQEAEKAAEERRRREEAEAEEARRESERKLQKEAEVERLRKSQEAMKKRKEEADRLARVAKWQPITVCVRSPDSNIQRRTNTSPVDDTKAIWKIDPGTKHSQDFDWWKPQDVVIYPPGQTSPTNKSRQTTETPNGVWAYAPGTSPDEDDEDWNPRGGSSQPEIWVFPPGTQPEDVGKNLKVGGEWAYPVGEKNFPPLPTPKNEWSPTKVHVHPKAKVPTSTDAQDGVIRGVWKINDGRDNDDMGDEDWRIAEIQVYPQGQEPKDLDKAQIQGVWGLAPDARPDENGDWKAEDLWFFGPGNEPAEDTEWSPQGVWTHSPESKREDWPPLSEPMDEWEPKAVWVVPPSALSDDDAEDWHPTGVWNFGNNTPDDAEDWKPYRVTVYPEGKEPENMEDFKVHGVWGLSMDAIPDDEGEWKASDVIFVGPGDEEPEEWRPQGVWTVADTEENNDGSEAWPPLRASPKTVAEPKEDWEPRAVWVVPPSALSDDDAEDWHATGVWNFGNNTPDDAEDWKPYQVTVYPEGKEPENLEEIKVHGVWGLSTDATPDDEGEWKASDIIFVGPGDDPPEDWRPQGVWTVSPTGEEEDEEWPPQKATMAGLEPKENWEPKAIWVLPPSKLDDDDAEDWHPTGVWNFGNATPDDAEDWQPYQVMVHPEGKEPQNLDDFKFHGVWGLSPEATPDDDGEWRSSDLIFVPPGEDPPEDWRPQGVWTVSPKSEDDDDEEWPPAKMTESMERAIVYPKGKAPGGSDKGLQGVWAMSSDHDDDDEDWSPRAVLMYKDNAKKGTSSEPRGIYGTRAGAKAGEDGNYSPDDLWFCLPGEQPPEDEDWNPKGTWEFAPSKKKKPTTPRKAWVYPQKKVPKEVEKGVEKGVWSYTPGKKVMDAGKKPLEVKLYEKGEEPEDLPNRHGAWGYAPDAKPDENGDYLPSAMWLFAPGETPPEDEEWQPMGTWTEAVAPKKASKDQMKKPADSSKRESSTSATKRPRSRQYSNSAWVYLSPDSAPAKGEKGNPQGCWTKCPGGSQEEPQELLIYDKGHEPPELEKLPHGTFGYAAGSQPDANGVWSPKDMLFFGPDEVIPADLQKPGTWTYPHGSRREISTWYKWEGDEIITYQKTEIFYMDTVTSFTTETKGKK